MAKKKAASKSRAKSSGSKKKKKRSGRAASGSSSAGSKRSAAADEESEVEELARLHLWQIQAVRDVLFVGAVVGIIWFGYVLRAVTVPLLVALLLAYLAEPLVQWLSRQSRVQMNRIQAVLSILVVIGGSIVVVLAIVLPIIIGQAAGFVGDIQDGTMHRRLSKITGYVPADFREDLQNAIDILPASDEPSEDQGDQPADSPDTDESAGDSAPQEAGSGDETDLLNEDRVRALIAEALTDGQRGEDSGRWLGLAGRGATAVIAIASTIIQIGLLTFLIPFYFFFFSLWYPHVLQFGAKFIPEKNKERTLELLEKMDGVVAGFVRGRIVVSIIMSVLLAVGWMICGVPYALPLGIMIGIFSIVPYLGGVGIPLAAGLLLVDQMTLSPDERIWLGLFGAILFPTLVFAIVQVIESYFLTPIIQGKATNLDPVTIVVAVLAGGSVLGVYGMLLSIPVAACARILFTEIILPRIGAWTRGEISDPLPIGRGD